MSPLRAALVIARRDYVASVWSRTFLFFLIGPLLPVIAGVMFNAAAPKVDRVPPPRAVVEVVAPAAELALIGHAHATIAGRLGEGGLPSFRYLAAGQRAPAAVPGRVTLTGGLDAPLLTGSPAALADVRRAVGIVLDRARADRVLARLGDGFSPPSVEVAERSVREPPAPPRPAERRMIAQLGQVVLMFLTVLLSGMVVSNMVEEKSNKVIEVLTAAVPVDGIFFGKLIAMLALSLTGIAVWGTMGVSAYLLFTNGGAGLVAPAVGWPIFLFLGLIYFCAIYLLVGAVFLGIGAQAGSVREVQTMSMPLTMAQLGVVALASSSLDDLDGPTGLAATVFPWSSPYAMLARAAEQTALWPHAPAILWQGLCVAVTIHLVGRWFRRGVLKSGRPAKAKRRWFGSAPR